MSGWENWELSMENETLVSDLAFKLHSQNISKTVTVWWDLLNHNASSGNDLTLENEINPSELNRTEDNVVCLMREALESGYDFKETLFAEIPCISLNKIFHAIKIDLDEIKFSSFCGFVSFWNNDLLIEQAMKAVVLPKLKEKSELSTCTIFSVTELAKIKPSQLCNYVLIPLVTDQTYEFTDAEFLSNVFSVLPAVQKDSLVLSLVKRHNIEESHWFLFQSLIQYLTPSGVVNIIECAHKWTSKFKKSIVFGRFLVSFCKNLDFFANKELLLEAIEKHDTLLKRQALKYLQQT